MTANEHFFQEQKPAAILKHSVLEEYCNVFTSMVGSKARGGPVWFIDGYAGPGRYEASNGEGSTPGSPQVAMQLSTKWRTRGTRDLRCVFIESDEEHVAQLRECLQPYATDGYDLPIFPGTVQKRLPDALRLVDGAPVLTFLDPFGVAMDRSLMVDLLLHPGRSGSSEVLLNINVEAVWRIGGNLEPGGAGIRAKVGQEKSIEKVDRFLGGTWWRGEFYGARQSDEEGSAAAAAERVIKRYRSQVKDATGCSSVYVPIRRRPGHKPLFLLTLFYRHPAAAYKFADAASRASKKWRHAHRALELADRENDEDTLFGGEFLRELSEADAKEHESRLERQWTDTIKGNMLRLSHSLGAVSVREHGLEILGSTLSLAGEREIRRAWDQLADEQQLQRRSRGPIDRQAFRCV